MTATMRRAAPAPYKSSGPGDYAPDCGCGYVRCNNGWVWHMGSEYPCGWRRRRDERRRAAECRNPHETGHDFRGVNEADGSTAVRCIWCSAYPESPGATERSLQRDWGHL